MGAWGHEPFDNDDASDWVYELEQAPDLSLVRNALGAVIETSGYLEVIDGSIGIAAAEVVAAAHRQPHPSLPESVTAWVAAHDSGLTANDLTLAVAAIDRIVGEDSELPALWREAADGSWAKSVQDLRRRLLTTS